MVVLGSFAKAGGGVGVAGGGARGTVVAAGGAIGFGRFAFFIGIRVDVAFQTGRLPFAVLVLASRARQTNVTVHRVVFAQVARRANTAAVFGCFGSCGALGTIALVCLTLCKPNGAFGTNFFVVDNIFKFARCAIGTFGAARFGGTAGRALVAWIWSIFFSGKRICRAKCAVGGTNRIVEFALKKTKEEYEKKNENRKEKRERRKQG